MCAYDNLKALTQDDEKLLCGRAEVIRAIVGNCLQERLTVVSSEPGLGVTSLLNAGIAPALRREGFIVAVFSDWQGRFFRTHLKEAIATAVREAADPLFFAQNEELVQLLAQVRARADKPVAVLLDQFEDYVRCHQNTELSDSFDAELAHALAEHKGAFIIGLQDHALFAFERLGQHIPNLLGFHIVLQPLTIDAAKEAVIAEARAIELDVEPAALDALTAASTVMRGTAESEPPNIHPFYLKTASGILIDAEARLKSTTLRANTIEARGGVDRIVLDSLDNAIGELGTTQVDLLFRWCTILISPEKHRLAVTEKGLTEYAGRWNRFVPGLLETLINAAMLRPIKTAEATRYEIARECNAPILRNWWERREAAIVARRRQIFRVTSISVALSAIVLMYVMWLIFSPNK